MLNHQLARTAPSRRHSINIPLGAQPGSSLRLLFLQLLPPLIYLLATVAGAIGYVFSTILIQPLRRLAATLLLRQRWQRLKDAVFYEFMLLLFQPAPVMLVVMWPGWVLVGVMWYLMGREGEVVPI